jgi:hypothetical protein
MTRLGVWKTGTCIAYENRVTTVPASRAGHKSMASNFLSCANYVASRSLKALLLFAPHSQFILESANTMLHRSPPNIP